MIKLKNISKHYVQNEERVEALSNFDLKVNKGDFILIECTSSNEKRALINCIGLLEKPDNGEVTVKGNIIYQNGNNFNNDNQKLEIGFVFQRNSLIEELTVLENLNIPCNNIDMSLDRNKKRVEDVVSFCGIDSILENRPSELDTELISRVLIARSLINQPSLIITDRIDSLAILKENKRNLWSKINQKGIAIVSIVQTEFTQSTQTKRIKINRIFNNNLKTKYHEKVVHI